MNFRLRQERNAFVFLVVVAAPLVLLTAPLPYLSSMSSDRSALRTRDDPAIVAQAFARADRNGDGFIDAREAGAVPGLLPIFALVDVDGDGRIDRRELAKARLARARIVEARI
jgi:Ca2+-binding EF-hand superfamily protein